MTLFAHRFAVEAPELSVDVPGRYEESRSARVDQAGRPIVGQPRQERTTGAAVDRGSSSARTLSLALVHKTTKADRDRPRNWLIEAGTRGARDPDAYALLAVKTLAGRDEDDFRPHIASWTNTHAGAGNCDSPC